MIPHAYYLTMWETRSDAVKNYYGSFGGFVSQIKAAGPDDILPMADVEGTLGGLRKKIITSYAPLFRSRFLAVPHKDYLVSYGGANYMVNYGRDHTYTQYDPVYDIWGDCENNPVETAKIAGQVAQKWDDDGYLYIENHLYHRTGYPCGTPILFDSYIRFPITGGWKPRAASFGMIGKHPGGYI